MAKQAPRPCTSCGVLVHDGTGRCDKHKVREGSFSDARRGTRHQRGYGTQWDKIRKRILARDHGLCTCEVCQAMGRVRIATEVDHRISKAEWKRRHGSLDGCDAESNLGAINVDCHRAKTARER